MFTESLTSKTVEIFGIVTSSDHPISYDLECNASSTPHTDITGSVLNMDKIGLFKS